ncbi:MAG: hypothetical protein Tsb0020_07990 [Haliangiales bacterium]
MDWFQPTFDPTAAYTTYNFHREASQQQVLTRMKDESPRVVLLSGERSSGRKHFIQSVAYRSRVQDWPVQVLMLDLAGFEIEQGTLTSFVEHRIRTQGEHNDQQRKEVVDLALSAAGVLSKSIFSGTILSLLLSLRAPVQKVARLFEANDSVVGPTRDEREILASLVRAIAEDTHLLIHVPDTALLTDTLRRWLLDETTRSESITLALSCRPDDDTSRLVHTERYGDPLRIEFERLTCAELRELIDHRFQPNNIPDDLIEELHRHTDGASAALALKFHQLITKGGLIFHPTGELCVAEGGLRNQAVIDVFEHAIYEPVSDLLDELPAHTEHMQRFLWLGALCGRDFPSRLLLDFMEFDEDAREDFIEVINEWLVEYSHILENFEYEHPAFLNQPSYGFRNDLIVAIILDKIPQDTRIELAEQLYRFLESRQFGNTRGEAHVLLSLCEYMEDPFEREACHERLAWWISQDEAEEFTEVLVEMLQRKEIDPQVLWQQLTAFELHWPPYRRLALIEAYGRQPEGVPFNNMNNYLFARAGILCNLARFDDALVDIEDWLQLNEDPTLNFASATDLKGQVLQGKGAYKEAKSLFERSLTITEKHLGPEHPHVASSLSRLALLLMYQGTYEQARPLLQRSLTIYKKYHGPEHPNVATTLHNLSSLLYLQGAYEQALPLVERSLAIFETQLGPQHPNVARSLHLLASILHGLGAYEEARPLAERSLAIYEKQLGPEHPDFAASLTALASILHGLGAYEEALPLAERSLAITETHFGPQHPYVAASLNSLASLLIHLGAYEEARPLAERSLAINEKQLGPQHPEVAMSLNNLASLLQDQGAYKEAKPLYERSLAICTAKLSAEHRCTRTAREGFHKCADRVTSQSSDDC